MRANIRAFNIFAPMKILIVSATENELITFDDPNIDSIIIGVGIPNAIFNLSNYLHNNTYDLIINIGICGSFQNSHQIGDVVEIIKDRFSEIGYQEDKQFKTFDTNFVTNTSFQVSPRTKLKAVTGITVNTVHGNEQSIQQVVNSFNPDVESMEGAACMMVAEKFNISFIQIRAISNYVQKRNIEDWNIDLAMKNLNKEVRNILSIL